MAIHTGSQLTQDGKIFSPDGNPMVIQPNGDYATQETPTMKGDISADRRHRTLRESKTNRAMPIAIMNVKSGHFLQEEQYGYFDASFFNISPNEAKAMDPKARMHLEGAYEALENAGIPISDLAGSDTSVFVGAFNEDYSKLMDRDPNTMPMYKVTGFLSPDGRTYMFDQRANGYARGEGIGTLILKPLADAIESNDPIHAVVRNTGMNQDGRTPGITLPSMEAQQTLIEDTYRQAGLDVFETDFFEAHGTGTQAGDKTEAQALSTALRTSDRDGVSPLYVGSIKSLMGHCEGASGVAGVIHSTLALKARCIPPNCNFEIPSERINFREWNIRVPTKAEHWRCNHLRRVSINSFGYGGTNVHAIIEEARTREQITNDHEPQSTRLCQKKVLFLSANEGESLTKLTQNIAKYVNDHKDPETFNNLLYTLGQRRSLLRYRYAVQASGFGDLGHALQSAKLESIRVTRQPRLCYVFTGQGAQWAGMGCELLNIYPKYKAAIHAADAAIATHGAAWSLLDELQDTKTSKVDEAYLSQPLCTALQIALVDLMRSWGINSVSVVGHSSGEIAAAYCAGILSLESAMQVAYYRGKYAGELEEVQEGKHGRMMAVGLSQDEALSQVLLLKSGRATVACINSPKSVTISGDAAALEELQAILTERGTFHRMLRVNVAYHSHHMKPIASKYAESLANLETSNAKSTTKFNSTVYPGFSLETNAEYWVQNMLNPVQFSEAVQRITSSQSSDGLRIDSFVEIGPHSALAGPLKQICADLTSGLRPTYFPSIQRKTSDLDSMHGLVSSLFKRGVKLDAGEVNFPTRPRDLQALTDMPPYPWNHTTRYWHQGRLGRNYLGRHFPPHDLLGTMTDDCSELDMTWFNQLRLTELPWLRDHTLRSEAIFPGAGYIAMAIEAARQKAIITETPIKSFVLREVSFSMALTIPDTPDGVEVSLRLEPLRESSVTTSRSWDTFRLLSYSSDRKATEHCCGLISTSQQPNIAATGDELQSLSGCLGSSSEGVKSYNTMLDKSKDTGMKLGDTFQLVSQCSLEADQTTCDLRIPDIRSSMPYEYESPQVVTTPVLDASLQVSILAIVNLVDTFEGPLLPTFVQELFVSKDIPINQDHTFRARGHTKALGPRDFSGRASVFDLTSSHATPVISITGSKFVFASASQGKLGKHNVEDRKRCWNIVWKPDVTFFNQSMVQSQWVISDMDSEELARNALTEKTAYFCIRTALEALSEADCEKMLPHHQYFLKWARRRLDLGRVGRLNYQTPDWQTNNHDVIRSTLKEASEYGAPGRMTVQVGGRLADVLRQEIDPLSLMMENDLFDQYYAESQNQDRAYNYVAKYLDIAAHKWPNLKILEIGAGTGSATSFALKALEDKEGGQFRSSSYHFTDLSAGFFEKARQKFSAWENFLEFKTLNIENDTQAQGFDDGDYDLIVAANVLHATTKMENTMRNVHKLLKPGGKLVLVEVTNLSHLAVSMVFGLLPGWWMGVAEGRGDSPLLSEDDWHSLLRRTGFTGLEICVRDTADPEKYTLSTIVTSKQEATIVDHQNNLAILYTSQSGLETAQQLATALQNTSWELNLRISSIEQSQASGIFYVFIDDRNGSMLANMGDKQLEALQGLLAAGKGLLWVTFGGLIESTNPDAGSVPGFIRALRSEYGSMKCITLDAQSQGPECTQSAIARILSLLDVCFRGNTTDLEYADRDGQLLIPRLVADNAANESVQGEPEASKPELQPFAQTENPLRLEMASLGLLHSFQFVSNPRMQIDINKDDVEVEIKSSALNFHDLMVATGQLIDVDGYGVECSGLVTQIGSAVDNFHIGQRVCALGSGCFGTHTRTSRNLVCAIPEDMSFEVAASIPSVFSTSYYSLYHAARLQPGETILIHSAAGGIGQACIKLASLIGATIYVTVGTPAKVDFLEKTYGLPRSHILNSRDLSFAPRLMALTDGKGVDVIINSLAGDALRESWRCIAMFGRFVDLGKKDAIENAHIGMAPFEKSASFIAVGFDLYAAYKNTVAGGAVRQVVDMFARKELTPIEPITIYQMSEMEKAFRFMQSGNHMGKIVINAARECMVPVIPRPLPGLRLRSDASYLIVGGLTGIGAAFAHYMVSKWSAKHLILLSRSGLKAKGASDLVSSLQQAGAVVKVLACDVANLEQLEAVLQSCSNSLPQIRGVIQGAMVLQDSVFMKMTLSKFYGALNPKILGTRNLHTYFLSRSLDLDFFVMLSSLAGITGNPSQSNYAAGNTYQDALAHHRAAKGLPALAIDIGMVTDTGWSVENWDRIGTGVGFAWAKQITTTHLLRLIEHHVLNSIATATPNDPAHRVPVAPQVCIGVKEVRAYDARFSHVAGAQMRSPAQLLAAKEQVSLPERIVAAGRDRGLLHAAILEALCGKVARLLDLPVGDIHADESLSEHGVDSLVAVEIRDWLGKEAGANVPTSDVLSGQKSIEQMVQGIVGDKLRG
ncbi:MAG: hypothetical protein Q9163_002690 [Psora crenata]